MINTDFGSVILDSTKIQCYMRCPRKYLFNYVFNWQLDGVNINFVFGGAWHAAMQLFYKERSSDKADMYNVFLKEWRNGIDEEDDYAYSRYKNPQTALLGISAYYDQFDNERSEISVIGTEITGKMVIDSYEIVYKMDGLVERDGEIGVLEHKSSVVQKKKNELYWPLSYQVNTYLMAALEATNNRLPVSLWGNFSYFSPKKVEIERRYHKASEQQGLVWYHQTTDALGRMFDDYHLLSISESLEVLPAFLPNPTACADYSGCAYTRYCNYMHNPLHYLDKRPIELIVKEWNPLAEEE